MSALVREFEVIFLDLSSISGPYAAWTKMNHITAARAFVGYSRSAMGEIGVPNQDVAFLRQKPFDLDAAALGLLMQLAEELFMWLLAMSPGRPRFRVAAEQEMLETMAARVIDQLSASGRHIFQCNPSGSETERLGRDDVGRILVDRLLRAVFEAERLHGDGRLFE